MKPDNIFIFMLIMIGLCISAVIYLPHTGSGSRVEIRINGAAVASYPLSSDRTETISCPDGGSNTMEIKDGAACMKEADCPDKVCVNTGFLRSDLEVASCLPNRTSLFIVNADPDSSVPDAVTGK